MVQQSGCEPLQFTLIPSEVLWCHCFKLEPPTLHEEKPTIGLRSMEAALSQNDHNYY